MIHQNIKPKNKKNKKSNNIVLVPDNIPDNVPDTQIDINNDELDIVNDELDIVNDQVDTLSNNTYIPDNEEIIDFHIDIQFSKRILHTDKNKITTMIHELYNILPPFQNIVDFFEIQGV